MSIYKTKIAYLALAALLSISISCSNDDDELFANVTINEGLNGDIGGDFTGNGGSTSQTFNWQNSLTTADYNADITSTATGNFNMVIMDAEGMVVLDRSLIGDSEPDSFSGVTQSGSAGVWTLNLTISDFNGDGSFSISEGD